MQNKTFTKDEIQRMLDDGRPAFVYSTALSAWENEDGTETIVVAHKQTGNMTIVGTVVREDGKPMIEMKEFSNDCLFSDSLGIPGFRMVARA